MEIKEDFLSIKFDESKLDPDKDQNMIEYINKFIKLMEIFSKNRDACFLDNSSYHHNIKTLDRSGDIFHYNEKNQYHRLDGPAVEFEDGDVAYYIEDEYYHKEDYEAAVYLIKNKLENYK